MKELVQVNDGQIVVSSRDIAERFEKEHGKVLRSIDNLVSQNWLTKNMFFETSKEYRGQEFRYYLMNRDGFSLLVMGFTGSKALEWKLKYIEAFNAMENQLKPTLPNFSDPAEAARAWANEYEAKQKALAQVAEMKPKAEFYDDVTGSEDTIDIKSVAKVLHVPKMGRNKLFAFLRDKNILNKRNEPYQYFVDKGYFRQVESSWELDGTVHINLKTVVFQKGVEFIKKLLTESGITPTEGVDITPAKS